MKLQIPDTFKFKHFDIADLMVYGGYIRQERNDAVVAPVPENDGDGSAPYIGNMNSKKFHYADCSSVAKMKDKNKVEIFSREEAIAEGYEPCQRCNP